MSEKLDDNIYFNLDKVLRYSKRFSSRVLAKHDIDLTIDQWVILLKIFEEQEQTQVELASAVNKDTASITRILDLLHDKKLVRRIPNPKDRRKSSLVITLKGSALVEKAHPIVQNIRAAGTQGVTQEELQITQRVLKKMIENMR